KRRETRLRSFDLRPEFGLETAPQRLQVELGKLAGACAAARGQHEVIERAQPPEKSIHGRPVTTIEYLAGNPLSQATHGSIELAGIASGGNDTRAGGGKSLGGCQPNTR